MKIKLTMTALLMATVSQVAMSQEQGLMPDAIPGGDQFEVNCLALIPGGDQFQNAIRQIDDELPEGIPGGDQFDRNAIPGGDQFEPYQIPGGDQFVQTCFEEFHEVGLLIPGGDQFDPQALERLALGELELAPSLIERSLKMDRSSVQQIANGGGLGFDGFIRPNPNLSSLIDDDLIPGGDQFDPSAPALDPLKIDDELPEGIIGIDGFSKEDAEDLEVAAADLPDELGPISYGPENGVVPVPVPAGCDWTGTWGSTYGILRLIQDGNQVSGDYSSKGFIKGTVGPGCNLKGTFDNRQEQIKGTYEFTREGDRFEGLWGLDGELPYERWKGRRSSSELPVLRAEERWAAACRWTGTWFTPTTGVRMRLVQDGARVTGEIGENLIVEGNTDTACEGRRDVRMEATVTDRETGADQSMTITLSSGGQRYAGTLGGSHQGILSSSVFSGSRASRKMPELTYASMPAEGRISDAGGVAQPATVPVAAEPEPDPTKTAKFKVNVGALCHVKDVPEGHRGHLRGHGSRYQGIIWVKANVFDKKTGKDVQLAPIGGYLNVNGDKERAWEIPQTDEVTDIYQVGLAAYGCTNFSQEGFSYGARVQYVPTGNGGRRRTIAYTEYNDDPELEITFEFDPEKYGYSSIEELVTRRRNRIRLMYKLNYVDKSGEVYPLGTNAKTHALADPGFCGTCKMQGYDRYDDIISPPKNGYPTGDGALTGFRNSGAEAFVLYDLERLPDGPQ